MSDPNKTPPDNSHNDLPSAKVTTLLGGDIDQHTHAPIFCEMQEIHREEGAELGTWKEAARWIKFEEDVEEGGDRWSKPHVATLSLHSLFELRVLLMQGAVLIEETVSSMGQAVDKAVHAMVYDSKMLPDNAAVIEKVKAQLLAVHEHQTGKHKAVSVQDQSVTSLDDKHKSKSVSGSKFQRHLPKGSEAANMLVGTMDCLEHPIMCFIKLKDSVILPGLCEVDIPTKFIFILIGGPDFTNYYQIGRSFSTLMSDQIFHEIAYKCRNREDLLTGIDEFLDKTTVLPPGEWDPRIRIEPPSTLPVVKIQDRLATHPDYVAEDKPAEEHGDDPALARTGKLFGGLIADIKGVSMEKFWGKDAFLANLKPQNLTLTSFFQTKSSILLVRLQRLLIASMFVFLFLFIFRDYHPSHYFWWFMGRRHATKYRGHGIHFRSCHFRFCLPLIFRSAFNHYRRHRSNFSI